MDSAIARGRPRTLLTIDDSPTQRNLVRMSLAVLDLEFLEAGTAAQALAILASKPVDVVIVDLNMPGMDGLELVRTLRASSSDALRTVPAILLTSDTSPDTRLRAMVSGSTAFVQKPVTSSNIREAVAYILQRTPGTSPAQRG